MTTDNQGMPKRFPGTETGDLLRLVHSAGEYRREAVELALRELESRGNRDGLVLDLSVLDQAVEQNLVRLPGPRVMTAILASLAKVRSNPGGGLVNVTIGDFGLRLIVLDGSFYTEVTGSPGREKALSYEQFTTLEKRGWQGDGTGFWQREWPGTATPEDESRAVADSLAALYQVVGIKTLLGAQVRLELFRKVEADDTAATSEKELGSRSRALLLLAILGLLIAVVLLIMSE